MQNPYSFDARMPGVWRILLLHCVVWGPASCSLLSLISHPGSGQKGCAEQDLHNLKVPGRTPRFLDSPSHMLPSPQGAVSMACSFSCKPCFMRTTRGLAETWRMIHGIFTAKWSILAHWRRLQEQSSEKRCWKHGQVEPSLPACTSPSRR